MQILRDKYGKVLGKIQDTGNSLRLYDSQGKYRGRYDKKTDKTYDGYGGLVGVGNLLTMLLTENRR